MKKSIIYLAAAIMVIPALNSCRKASTRRLSGEWNVSSMDYSGTSTSSTTNNTFGSVFSDVSTTEESMSEKFNGTEWTQSYDSKTTDASGGVSTSSSTSMTAGSGTVTSTYTTGGISTTSNGDWSKKGSISYSIDKEGTFVKTTTYTEEVEVVSTNSIAGFGTYTTTYSGTETVTETISGTWAFLGKNKSEDIARNERVAFFFKSSTIESTETETETEVFVATDGTTTTSTSTDTYSEDESDTYVDSDSDETWLIVDLGGGELSISGTSDMTSNGDWTSTSTSGGVTTTDSGSTERSETGSFTAMLTEVE